MASDEYGNLIRAHYPDTNPGNNFVSYDKVNQLVFHSHRATRLEPDGTLGTQTRSLITVYDRKCFSSDNNCDPTVTSNAKSRLFRDVGEMLGPTSDLGNGCVAVLSFRRPGEEGGNTIFTKFTKPAFAIALIWTEDSQLACSVKLRERPTCTTISLELPFLIVLFTSCLISLKKVSLACPQPNTIGPQK